MKRLMLTIVSVLLVHAMSGMSLDSSVFAQTQVQNEGNGNGGGGPQVGVSYWIGIATLNAQDYPTIKGTVFGDVTALNDTVIVDVWNGPLAFAPPLLGTFVVHSENDEVKTENFLYWAEEGPFGSQAFTITDRGFPGLAMDYVYLEVPDEITVEWDRHEFRFPHPGGFKDIYSARYIYENMLQEDLDIELIFDHGGNQTDISSNVFDKARWWMSGAVTVEIPRPVDGPNTADLTVRIVNPNGQNVEDTITITWPEE